jgi:hypothetical protein
MKMDNKVYDILKEVALTILPAIATLYAVVGKIWGLPFVTEIPATIMAVDTAMGAILHISTKEYNKEIQSGNV